VAAGTSKLNSETRQEPAGSACGGALNYGQFSEQLAALVPQMGRVARCYSQSAADADDLVQLTCEKALARWRQWSGKAPLKHWLMRILLNASHDRSRSRSRRQERLGFFGNDNNGESDEHGRQDNVLYMQQVLNAVARLPNRQREVVVLVALDELSYRQTAAALSVPIGTVMSRLARAREALRQDLADTQPALPLPPGCIPNRRTAGR
jgi:RNA polymerase sigma-70 factor (ECF subfamily)